MKRILSVDALSGRHTIAHDDGDGGLVLETKQNVGHIIESNKQMYNQVSSQDKWGDLTHVARLPLTVVDELNKKNVMRGFAVVDEKAFRMFLNDPDNRFFRTRPGTV
jgi:hypothetical protein